MEEKLVDVKDRSERAIGCVLAAAIGDAIAHPTEFLSMEEIHAEYGEDGVQGYELFWTRDGRRFAPYTDDTQMSEAVLRSLLWGCEDGLNLEATMMHMAFGFVRWLSCPQGGHRDAGHACQSGAELLLEGTHWSEAGSPDARGCGSVMRAYPFGLVFRDDPATAEHWAAEHSRLTHNHPGAIASYAGLAAAVAALARGGSVETARHRMLQAAEARCLETATLLHEADAAASDGADPVTTLDRLRGWIADCGIRLKPITDSG